MRNTVLILFIAGVWGVLVLLDRPGVRDPPKECVLMQEALWQDGGLGVCSSSHHTVVTEEKGK